MFTEEEKSAPLSFISNMVRSWLPSYANWATLRKEICGVGSAHGKQVVAQKNPFVISTVTPMSKNRLPLNIILTTAAAWRLPAEPWVIPALMYSLAGLMNFIPTDDVYLPVRPTRLRPLNQKSNVRLSWHSVHDKYQPVRSPGVLVSVVRYCINRKMKLSATVLTRLCVNITNLPGGRTRCVAGGSRPTESGNTPPADGAGYSEKGGGNHKKTGHQYQSPEQQRKNKDR